MTISRWILLRIRNVLDKSCKENRTNILRFAIFFPENRAVYELMSKNLVEPEGPHMTSQYDTCARPHIRAPARTCAHMHADKYAIPLFHGNCYANAPQCYVILRRLSCLFLRCRFFRAATLTEGNIRFLTFRRSMLSFSGTEWPINVMTLRHIPQEVLPLPRGYRNVVYWRHSERPTFLKDSSYTTDHTHRSNTDTHHCSKWNSNN
jgi:hypothetical protein